MGNFCKDGDKEPIIYHGHTLTSKLLFSDVLKAIKSYGFAYSTYPLILSIENHCSSKYKDIIASLLEEHLGNLIYKLPVDFTSTMEFPTLKQLERKILIKDKADIWKREKKEKEEEDESKKEEVESDDSEEEKEVSHFLENRKFHNKN